MKKVLVLYYSQTGQLTDVVKSFAAPLEVDENVEVVYQNIEPKTPYPFPWGYLEFFDIFLGKYANLILNPNSRAR